jgi:hypothetical protein
VTENQLTARQYRMEQIDQARTLLIHYLSSSSDTRHYPYAPARLGIGWLLDQGLAALIWHDWRGRSTPDISAEFVLCINTAYYMAVGDAELHRRELESVLQALRAQDIEAIAFKGAALAYTVYPDAVCRPMGDLDLWLRANQMAEAAATLEQLGYHAQHKPSRPQALMIRARNELPLYGTRSGSGLVELHWGVFPGEWLQHTARIDDNELWTRTMPATLAGQPALILSPEDNLIQIAIHMAITHNMSSPWLRGLVDIALLARHYPIDWEVVVQRARAWRVATPLWLVLSLAVDLTGLHEADEAARQLQPSALRCWMIGRFASAESLVMMRDLSASNWRYVFLLLLVDRKRDAIKLVFRALWPEREWLVARYGRYAFSTRLRHLVDAVRGKI